MSPDSLDNLNQRLKHFAQARDWEQFHSPKNLAMALSGEVGELLEHFQWLTEAQSYDLNPEKKQEVAFEMADILIYLIRCAERLDIDIIQAAEQKMDINETRFPIKSVMSQQKRAEDYD